MPRPTFLDLLKMRVPYWAAILGSAKNPDGTDYTMPVSGTLAVSALPAGNNNIGDVDVASIAAGVNTIGGTLDAGPSWSSSRGVAGERVTSADASGADLSITDAPTAGQKLVITDIMLSVDTAMRVNFEEEDSAAVLLSVYMAANSFLQITPRSKFKLPNVDKKLQLRTSAAGNVAVTAFYHSEA